METLDAKLNALMSDPSSLTVDELRDLNRRYPYFPMAAIALLEGHADELPEEETAALKLHLAVITADKKALFDLLGERAESFANIYPHQRLKNASTTDNAIDTFFANYGMADPAETALIERMIFNPMPSDYSEQMLGDTQTVTPEVAPEKNSLESRIDAFVRDHAPAEEHAPSKAKPAPVRETPKPKTQAVAQRSDDSLLSESLAKIFIKQGRYERAYEIISNLSLNYPKKSIYFADQLRFLQKLIRIKQAAEAKNS